MGIKIDYKSYGEHIMSHYITTYLTDPKRSIILFVDFCCPFYTFYFLLLLDINSQLLYKLKSY